MKTPSKTFVPDHVNNGGGNKLITRKQIFFIESLAHALGKTGQGLALENYQKSIASLRSDGELGPMRAHLAPVKPSRVEQWDDNSALMMACRANKNPAVAETLIRHGADVNIRNGVACSAFLFAARRAVAVLRTRSRSKTSEYVVAGGILQATCKCHILLFFSQLASACMI